MTGIVVGTYERLGDELVVERTVEILADGQQVPGNAPRTGYLDGQLVAENRPQTSWNSY